MPTVVITGASAGIGAALARAFASGNRLLLVGRDAGRLASVAEAVAASGGRAETARLDVRDRDALAAALIGFDDRSPVDLVIANAGASAGLGLNRTPEPDGVAQRLMEINYAGTLNTVEPLLPRLIARRGGRIVIVSSLAALRPLPDLPSYSATKAAVAAYGTALRGWLRPYGVGVTVVYPGFVTTDMSTRHRGFKPFERSAEDAAAIIRRGVLAGRARIAFPFPLVAGIALSRLLPPALGDWAMRPFAAEVEPDHGV